MIIKNKKNGTNILTYKDGAQNICVPILGGEIIEIPSLVDFSQIINKSDFHKTRDWFEVVEEKKESITEKKESTLERAKKEVQEYTSTKNKE